MLDAYKHDEDTRKIITNVIRQEIAHEWQMMEQVADKESYIAKTREAMDAMTVGIIETLGLVIGLLAAHASTLTIGLTGLIGAIGGLIAIMSTSYVTSKANYDLHEGRTREIHVKRDINPAVLKRELEKALVGKGIGSETVKDIMGIIGDDTSILSNLVKSMKSLGEAGEPKEAIKTTGLFFIIGAVPSLIPFFIGVIWDAGPLIPAVMAFVVAVLTDIDSRVLCRGSVREKDIHEDRSQYLRHHGDLRCHLRRRPCRPDPFRNRCGPLIRFQDGDNKKRGLAKEVPFFVCWLLRRAQNKSPGMIQTGEPPVNSPGSYPRCS